MNTPPYSEEGMAHSSQGPVIPIETVERLDSFYGKGWAQFCCDAARDHFDAFEGVVRARIEAQTRLDQMTQNHNEVLRLYSKWRSRAEKAEAELERWKATAASSLGTEPLAAQSPPNPSVNE